jgi:rubrerythrin
VIECNVCGYLSHHGFGNYPNMKCPNCGSTNLSDDEERIQMDDGDWE